MCVFSCEREIKGQKMPRCYLKKHRRLCVHSYLKYQVFCLVIVYIFCYNCHSFKIAYLADLTRYKTKRYSKQTKHILSNIGKQTSSEKIAPYVLLKMLEMLVRVLFGLILQKLKYQEFRFKQSQSEDSISVNIVKKVNNIYFQY